MTINVLYIVANLDVGGAERHITQIVTQIDRTIVYPRIFTILNKGELSEYCEKNNIEVVSCMNNVNWFEISKVQKLFRLFSGAWKLYRFLRNEKPDVVHFFLPMPYIVGGFVSIAARTPVRIMSRRSLNLYQKGHAGSATLEHWLHSRMTKILGNSEAVVNELHNVEGVPSERLKLIYNGVHVPELMTRDKKIRKRNSLKCLENELVIVCVANLIPYKGHSDLIKSLSVIVSKLPENWTLLCVGNDSHGIRLNLESQVKKMNLNNHVRFIGGRDDVDEILQAADISVLSSHQEGFSNAVLEGMAVGLPSVVTRVGGNAEAIRDGIDGLIVEPHSPDMLGEALLTLALDEFLRKKMGAAARKRVEKTFSVEQCLKSYEALYQEVMVK